MRNSVSSAKKSTKQWAGGILILVGAVGLTLLWRVQPLRLQGFRVQGSGMRFHQPDSSTQARLSKAYGQLPLHFEANKGQTDRDVKFFARGSGYSLFLTASETVLSLSQVRSAGCGMRSKTSNSELRIPNSALLRMRLVGANPQPQVSGAEELPGKVNYFIGNDPKKWQTNVETYGKVKYGDVYDGIDLVYYGNQRQLEYDFVVAPGADPQAIALEFNGADKAEVNKQGDLVLRIADSDVRFQKPFAYQNINGERREIPSRYVLLSDNQDHVSRFTFHVGSYDTTQPLIIDPTLAYSTYFGGAGFDTGGGIAVDDSGNAYVTGTTDAANLAGMPALRIGPAHNQSCNNCSDAFVAKLDPTGTALVYLTILGGSNDSSDGSGIALDSAGNAYITGSTRASDFPTPNGFQTVGRAFRQKAFVAKLNSAGFALLYATMLGGSQSAFEFDQGLDLAADNAGNAYVVGATNSADFPTKNALQPNRDPGRGDGFAAKFDTTRAGADSLIFSTYLGTSVVGGLAIDNARNIYVTGSVNPNRSLLGATPTLLGPPRGAFDSDAFVLKLNTNGSAVLYLTYIGGSGIESGPDVVVDSADNAYLTGETQSANFPATPGAVQTTLSGIFGQNVFVAKLNPTGNALVYSTYLGGNRGERGFRIAVDNEGIAHVTGETFSLIIAGTTPTRFGVGGSTDIFVATLNITGSALLDLSILGSSGGEAASGLAIDRAGGVYLAGFVTDTAINFPTVNALQVSLNGLGDAFIAKIQGERNHRLAFTAHPRNAKINQPLPAAVQVSVLDADGNVDTNATSSITIALGKNPSGATLSGTLTKQAVNGVATFSDLSLDKEGRGYTLIATASGLARATSKKFKIGDPPFIVNSVSDDDDEDLTDGSSTTGKDLNNEQSESTLRAAIQQANEEKKPAEIRFDISGDGVQTIIPGSPLPDIEVPIVIDGYTQSGSRPNTLTDGDNAVLLIELTGSNAGKDANGLTLKGGNSTVRGLVINQFQGGSGIRLVDKGDNAVEGNFIGTGVRGFEALGNFTGVEVTSGSKKNRIGGTTPAQRNVIGGRLAGVFLHLDSPLPFKESSRQENQVMGNFIGTDATGRRALSNTEVAEIGVFINQSPGNTIGGDFEGARNIISGNNDGIRIQDEAFSNAVQGNFIGTDVTGTQAVENVRFGVAAESSNTGRSTIDITIGGTSEAARNVISGNHEDGILLRDLGDSRVQGNFIGTDVTGTKDLGNQRGIRMEHCLSNRIGGDDRKAGNLISANKGSGISISDGSHSNEVQSNFIGTQADGRSPLGNVGNGVVLFASGNLFSGNNLIGSESGASGNVIAFNGANGVAVGLEGSLNKILGNSIFSNGGLGIDLKGPNDLSNGVTPDSDSFFPVDGGNHLQKAPHLLGVTPRQNGVFNVKGELKKSIPNTGFLIQFFANTECDPSGFGEGQVFLTFERTFTDGNGDAFFNKDVSIPAGHLFITATATDFDQFSLGNTSEFSKCLPIGGIQLTNPQVDPAHLTVRGGSVAFGVTVNSINDVTSVQALVRLPGGKVATVNLFLDDGTPKSGEWWSDNFLVPRNMGKNPKTFRVVFVARDINGFEARSDEITFKVDGTQKIAKGGGNKGGGRRQPVLKAQKGSGLRVEGSAKKSSGVQEFRGSENGSRLTAQNPKSKPQNFHPSSLPTLSGEDWTAVIDPLNDLLMLTLRQPAEKDFVPDDNAANRVILLTPTQYATRNTQYVMFVGANTQEVWSWDEPTGTFTDVTDWVWWDEDGQQMMVVLPWSSVGFAMEFGVELKQ